MWSGDPKAAADPNPEGDAVGELSELNQLRESERRDEERRSPVGDFMLGALAAADGKPLSYAQLLSAASEQRLSVSQVLGWIAKAKEGSLVAELTLDDHPALRLTAAGQTVVRSDRRRTERRAR